MKLKYYYDGPVTRWYDYYFHYSGYTMASSEKQALNNLRGRIKREKGLTMDSKLELNLKYLKQMQVSTINLTKERN